ncbi:FKBP-type peptidyl-prolyl cis-trans isomerase [Pedobacter lusitanus]|uniref:FKBP-type peptidyl-prolyl cis-trans isomerase n=1 Tax=Pedobacter lusitanus TaxID=1503925 RepID=UPI0006975A02|nr:FKBP-type peptidyl-prolyl cis-trans isomerase [Pedobacter lusitanus]
MLKSKVILLFIAGACSLAACKTDPAYDRATQAAIDDNLIKGFIAKNNIPAKNTKDGLYYQIIKGQDGTLKIDSLDTVVIHYVGRLLLDNTVLYDSTQNLIDTIASKIIFGTTIEGWRKGIPLVNPGGKIRLIVPSTMAYQNRVVSAMPGNNNMPVFLPANSILDFNIQFFRVGKFKIKTPQTQN